MKSPRVSARALILRGNSLLAIRAKDAHGEFFVLPGGGQNHGETLPEALLRECREELGVEIEGVRINLVAKLAEREPKLDILVNNAGMARRQPFLEATEDAWDEVLGVNLKGVYFLSQAAARWMAAQGSGKIVNISSVHDERPMTGNSTYCIAKAGMVMLTKSLALELAPLNIQVNCVSPGAIATDENRDRLDDPAYRAKVVARIPSGRVGSVEDVTGAVVLLASAEADYITGSHLYVDGGMLLHE